MTTLQLTPTRNWITRFAQEVENQFDTLTDLDRLVGDGDFGINIRSALRDALVRLDTTPPRQPGHVFARVSDAFLNTGGTSGPLLGLWFGRIGDIDHDEVTASDFATAVSTATQAVQRLGNAQVGHKTMVDAMVPAATALTTAAHATHDIGAGLDAASAAAGRGAESTRSMVARRGRASYVGDHARGVVDPGAQAIALFFAAATSEGPSA
ncbi:MAG: dihydroxyacetone kinase subunit DhaL [Rhodococcus sp. (in: high G+C Gram-positive bacteria)]